MLKDIFLDGIWRRNVASVQLLGLCPLLGISYTVENAVGLAIATAFVLIVATVSVSCVRKFIPYDVRLPCFVAIIATLTTVVAMFMEAYFWNLYVQIALFVQIIVTNCMILGRVETVAYQNKLSITLTDAIAVALGFAVVLIALGAIRELSSLFLPIAQHPVGAFVTAGLLLAGIQFIRDLVSDRSEQVIS